MIGWIKRLFRRKPKVEKPSWQGEINRAENIRHKIAATETAKEINEQRSR
jgi:hypothetical protein